MEAARRRSFDDILDLASCQLPGKQLVSAQGLTHCHMIDFALKHSHGKSVDVCGFGFLNAQMVNEQFPSS